MLTVTGQNENSSHRLQIGKDQKGDNQRDDNEYQSKFVGYVDDILIFKFADDQWWWFLSTFGNRFLVIKNKILGNKEF